MNEEYEVLSYKIHPDFTGKAPILVEDQEGEYLLIDWDFCSVPECEKRVYFNSEYCYLHNNERKIKCKEIK